MPDQNDPSSYDPNDPWEVPSEGDPDFVENPNMGPLPPDKVREFPSKGSDTPAKELPAKEPDQPQQNPEPQPQQNPEPMKDGLEDEPPEDEEEKPPIQPRVAQKQVKLPGAKGPLQVDSIGDYLEDVDWTAIDSESRSSAASGYPPSSESSEDQEDKKEDQEDKKTDAPPEPDAPQKMATGADVKKAADALGIGDIGNFLPPAPPKMATGADVSKAADALGIGGIGSTFMPQGGQGSPDHIASQPSVDLADYGTQGTSSYDIPGQTSSAKDDAVEKATDSISTATGRIVDTLQALAQAMNAHSHRIAQIEDTLDLESESDVG